MRWWALHERKSEYGKEKLGGLLGLARVEFSKEKRRPQGGLGQKQRKKKWVAKFSFLI
jgi:hypothetical protein